MQFEAEAERIDDSVDRIGSDSPTGWVMPSGERRLLLAITLVSCVLFTCTLTIADPDLWGHTLYGLRAIDQGVATERVDPFSYTAPAANWVNHEWMSEYQFGLLWSWAGSWGLVFWRNLAVLIVFGVAAWSISRSHASVGAAVLLLVLGAECLSDFVVFVRPQLATFALFAVSLAILRIHWDRPESRAIWMLPLLMLVWVNCHGGFLAGVGILGVFAAAWFVRCWLEPQERGRMLQVAVICFFTLASTLVNPYGIDLHRMLWQHLVTEQPVREWQALWETTQSLVYYVPFLLVVIAFTASRRWKWIDLAIIAVVAVQAVSHLRHVALLSIATLVLLPAPLTDALDRVFPQIRARLAGQRAARLRICAVLAVTVFLGVLQVRGSSDLWRAGIAPWDIAVETRSQVPGMPLAAVSLLKSEQIGGNLVTDYGWGQFVLWHLHPQVRVAFDGRYRTVYPPDVEREFLQFQEGRPTIGHTELPIIDTYPTDIALLPVDGAAAKQLAERTDWVTLYRDAQSVLLVADRPRFQALVERMRNDDVDVARGQKWELFPGDSARPLPIDTENSARNGTEYAKWLSAH